MILSKFAEISLTIVRGMESCLEKLENKDRPDMILFHRQWEKHIFCEGACGPKSEIPRGGYLHGDDLITEDTYRTLDGMACFGFRFHNHSDRCDAEIVSVPDDGTRALPDMEGKLIRTGNNPPVKTYSQAKKLAKVWAEYAWRYIKKECAYGDRFHKAGQEESGEGPGRYYNPGVYGKKVVRMR